jgi:hypothetical protein
MTTIMSRTAEYSVQPFAVLTENLGSDAIDNILDSLENDGLVHGPVIGYNDDAKRIDAIFQVIFTGEADASHDAATRIAVHAFEVALGAANVSPAFVGASVVEGGDPDLLP